jgi:ribonuclease D
MTRRTSAAAYAQIEREGLLNKAIEWDVTDRLPCTPPNLKPPKPEAALRALDELEGLITETATREGLSESRISSEDTRELLRWVRWHFSRKLRAK